jgi:hypothetical protein
LPAQLPLFYDVDHLYYSELLYKLREINRGYFVREIHETETTSSFLASFANIMFKNDAGYGG